MSSIADRLFGWTPFRSASHGGAMLVDWCHLGSRRMIEPFFYATVAEAMRQPFNLVFQQRTPIEALAALPPGLPIAGFIFHMSRCGSTLVAQALAAFESDIVVSEPAPLHTALRAASSGRAGRDEALTWLVGLAKAYAQPRFTYERRLFVKFAVSDVLEIAMVRRAFPDVPWIFLTRDPAEIMASHGASTGVELMPGQIAPHLLGLDAGTAWALAPPVYQAQALAAFGRAALDARATGRGLIVDYAELPEAVWTRICPHFGLSADRDAIEAMRAVSRRHSKDPAKPFAPDRDPNRGGAAPFRPIADAIVGPVMEALRTAGAAPAL